MPWWSVRRSINSVRTGASLRLGSVRILVMANAGLEVDLALGTRWIVHRSDEELFVPACTPQQTSTRSYGGRQAHQSRQRERSSAFALPTRTAPHTTGPAIIQERGHS